MEHVVTREAGYAGEENQHLTFTLGSEEYGVDILKVQEIKGYSALTRLPNTPEYLKGVMNLRGTIIPIVDLRSRFGMEPLAVDRFTVVLVVSVRNRVMGLVVDGVSDVVNIPADQIQPVPEFRDHGAREFLQGIARTGEKLIILLDIERVMGTEAVEAHV